MMAGMKIQLVCMLLLAFSSWSLCSDSEEEMKALEADLLTSMHTSKLKVKAHVPSWKMTLLNVCSLVNNLNSPAEETGDVHEEQLITRRKLPTALDGFSLEAMLTIYQLHKICHSRAFQHWELIQEDILDTGNDKNEKEEVIKRKIPYILKRQLYENKPRRPYILKRDSYYY
ncbi:neurotensin/neuromedin N isoform X2 [Piliocolobus tephrosceles]|uniref:neurotensin/neuromedin N isoform X2 n=1 Tax=Piliocolobus tephrosceles TaxID=591936 RepID=UPI000C29DB6B|nr:neurotensin/neuromedin N isoform X2 [Piliocolobus tephrosceles]